jgi:hypothetical protein
MNAKADLSIGTNDFSLGGWINTSTLAGGYLFSAYSTTPIIYLALAASGAFEARYHDSGAVNVSANTSTGLVRANEWHHLVLVGDRDGLMQIYLDGVSVGNVSIAAGAANSLTTLNALMIGANNSYLAPGGFFNGAYQDFRFYNGKALSATEIKNWYLEYADKPVLQAQPEYWLPTLANVTAGALSNTGFEVVTGSYKVSQDSLRSGSPLGSDMDMEAVGTSAWTAASSAQLTKQTTDPVTGSRYLRVAYGGIASPYAAQGILTTGRNYRVTGWARGDGTWAPNIFVGVSGTAPWIGTNSTSWQRVDFTSSALTGFFGLFNPANSAGYVEFDDITVNEIGTGKKWIECVTAGVSYTPSTVAYGTWVFRCIRPAGGIVRLWVFGNETALSTAPGYYYYDNGASPGIFVQPGGSAVCGASKAMTQSVEYLLAISRTTTGAFKLFRKEPAASWEELGTGTNATHTSSKFMGFNSTAGSKHALLNVHQGVLGIPELSALY